MRKILTACILAFSFLFISTSAYAYTYECTVYFYSSAEAHKYSFELDRYDSKIGERVLRDRLQSEGKDPQSISCAVY